MDILKWKLNLSLITVLFVILSLTLIFPSTAWTSKKFAGNFKTEHIRELWQVCSVAHQSMNTPQHIYFRLCDCAIDVMRTSFDNESSIRGMTPKQSAELAVLVKLNCNKWKFDENENSKKEPL